MRTNASNLSRVGTLISCICGQGGMPVLRGRVPLAALMVTLCLSLSMSAAVAAPHTPGHGWLLAAGDLDGDGKGDAVEYYGSKMDAVRGTDGSTMWSFDATRPVLTSPSNGGLRVWPAGNLDPDPTGLLGTPTDDLIVMAYAGGYCVRPGSPPTVCEAGLTLRALRGEDGSVLWDRPIEGASVCGSEIFCLPGATVIPLLPSGEASDLDGDGAPDLLVSVNSVGVTSVATTVLSGRLGVPIGTFPASHVSVIPDATGDGLADVLTHEYLLTPSGSEYLLTLWPGKGGPPTWARTYTMGPGHRFTAMDVSGDGRGDVLFLAADYPSSDVATLTAFSGVDGRSLWSTSVPELAGFQSAGDVAGDGGTDVLVHRGDWARIARGSDGSTVWDHTFGSTEGLTVAGDPSGDGAQDLVGTFERDGEIDVRLISGKDRSVVWSNDELTDGTFWPLGGDVTGDGRHDLVLEDSSRMRLLSGATGGQRWMASFGSDERVTLSWGPDRGAIFVSRPWALSQTQSFSMADGTQHWVRG